MATKNTIEIAGLKLQVLDRNSSTEQWIPKINTAYKFTDNAFDIIMDLIPPENAPIKKPLLTGHAGVGKSSVFEQLAARINQPVLRAPLNGQMAISDFVGTYIQRGGETVWIDGMLTTAMRLGCWLVLDEVDFGDPNILATLNGILEPKDCLGNLVLKEKGHEVVEPHPAFRLIATANTIGAMKEYRNLYPGAFVPNDAFLDRWRVYYVTYLGESDEIEVLSNTMGWTDKGQKWFSMKMVKSANLIREAFTREEVGCTFSMRRLFDWADQIRRHKATGGTPLERVLRAAEATVFSKVSSEDRAIIKGIIERVVGGGKDADF